MKTAACSQGERQEKPNRHRLGLGVPAARAVRRKRLLVGPPRLWRGYGSPRRLVRRVHGFRGPGVHGRFSWADRGGSPRGGRSAASDGSGLPSNLGGRSENSFCFRDAVFAWSSASLAGNSESPSFVHVLWLSPPHHTFLCITSLLPCHKYRLSDDFQRLVISPRHTHAIAL